MSEKCCENGEILRNSAIFARTCGGKRTEKCAEMAEKCDWNVAGEVGISESDGQCFASETKGASK